MKEISELVICKIVVRGVIVVVVVVQHKKKCYLHFKSLIGIYFSNTKRKDIKCYCKISEWVDRRSKDFITSKKKKGLPFFDEVHESDET